MINGKYEKYNDTSLSVMLREGHFDEKSLPYERFMTAGPQSLTDAELITILLRTGSANRTPMSIASEILKAGGYDRYGLNCLQHMSLKDLRRITGVGEVKAVRLKCVAEISRRMAVTRIKPGDRILSGSDIADRYMERLRHEETERVFLMMMDGRGVCIGEEMISLGSVNRSVLSPREVFICAIRHSAVGIAVIHNHPSGDPTPSDQDVDVTRRLVYTSEIMGIRFYDHLIIGDGIYYSFSEEDMLL